MDPTSAGHNADSQADTKKSPGPVFDWKWVTVTALVTQDEGGVDGAIRGGRLSRRLLPKV